MSPYKKKQKEKRRKNLFRKWHRRIGFAAALFLVNLSLTGFLLNHSEDFELHKSYVSSDWLIDLYGVKAPDSADCIKGFSPQNPICQLAEKIYYGNSLLINETSTLVGLVKLEQLFYLATQQKLYIYTDTFELVEIMDKSNGLPGTILELIRFDTTNDNINNPKILIKTENQQWSLQPNDLSWQLESPLSIMPVKLQMRKGDKIEELQNLYLDKQITHLKFIQDLHSGRIFSLPGKLLNDLVALIVIILALSGFFAWQKRKDKVE